MGDFGIRASKDGFSASGVLTDSLKKNFSFISDDSSPKVYYAGFIEEASPGLNVVEYTHNLGYYPAFFLFATDSVTNPTFYRLAGSVATATTTKIIGDFMAYAYLVILVEGSG
jgi:hypothetical protein